MSYDINFWFPKPGQTFNDWAESFDGYYPPGEQDLLSAVLDDVRTQAQSVLPDAEVREELAGFAVDDDASGISFGYSFSGVSLSCPYRCGTGSARVPLMYDLAQVVASLTGLQAHDPQTDTAASVSNLDVAVNAYEKTARFAASLLSRPE